MMKDEQNWNKKDLSVFKTQPLQQLILQAYKYQRFKTSVAIQKINRGAYSEKTTRTYLDVAKNYLFNGVKCGTHIASRIYYLLDQYKAAHVGILTPAKGEEYKPRKLKPSSPSPLKTTNTQTTKTTTKIVPTQYGIKYENTIKLFDSKDFCLGYKECFEVFNKDKTADLVTVNYELVVDEEN